MIRRRSPSKNKNDSPRPVGPDTGAEWAARLGSDQLTRLDHQMFQEWLERNPNNALDFDHHAQLFNSVGALANNTLARDILLPVQRQRLATGFSTRRKFFAAGTALAAASVIGVTYVGYRARAQELYETKIGERRRIVLHDGSIATLNTNSRIRVHFLKADRRVFLDRGQAFFEVAKSASRPFRVFACSNEIRAIGTAFDVQRDGQVARVTLEEGKVAIFEDLNLLTQNGLAPLTWPKGDVAQTRPTLVMAPGQEVRLTPSSPPHISEVELDQIQAWRDGRVILNSTPLGEAAEDINRYGGRRIVVADPRLASLPISGVFHTDQPEAFAEAVAASFHIDLNLTDDGLIILSGDAKNS